MSFPRYPEYKDSVVEWLGAVPAHWPLMRFKWQIDRNDGGVWGDDPDGDNDTIVLRSTEQTVDGRWRLDDPATRKLTEAEKISSVLKEGDLLVTKSSGSALHIGKTTLVIPDIAALDCCYSNFMQRIRTKAGFNPRLAWYVMNNEIARAQFDLASNSTTGLANLNGTMIGELVLTVPSGDEQSAITAFLDHETAKIDALVVEQEKLIALLKEKRQAVISHAVTKGLNPAAPMKDSGIELLGAVPAHWNVLRLKHVCPEITVGIVVEPSKYYVAEGVPALRSLNIAPGAVTLDNLVFISDEANELHAKSKLGEGDLVAVRSGQPGTTAVIPNDLDGCNCIDLIIMRRPTVASEWFLCWYLSSDAAVMQFSIGSGGAIQQHFNVGTATNLVVPVPPSDEQQSVVSFIDTETAKLDMLVVEARRAINLLRERRSALISAAVTGKIDVRGFA